MLGLVQQFKKSLSGTLSAIREMSSQLYPQEQHSPSAQDVIAVKQELLSRLHLPLELIDTIIDYAEYWPKSVTARNSATIYSGRDENRLLLRSFPIGFTPEVQDYHLPPDVVAEYATSQSRPWPNDREFPNTSTADVLKAWTAVTLPRSEHSVRKVVFKITSHDQGWGGEGFEEEYKGSYTWFDVGLEKLCAYPEDSVPEQHNNAPWPQFRLQRHAVRQVTLGNGKKVELPDNSSLACSLRTVLPEAVLVPKSTRSDDDSDSTMDDNSDDGGGLVGPPDELNPGSQLPYRAGVPYRSEPSHWFMTTRQTGGLVGPPDELNPGSQAPYRAAQPHFMHPRGRCGVGMATPANDSQQGSSSQNPYGPHQIPPSWSTGEGQSSSRGLVGPPDGLNPGSQDPCPSPPPPPPQQRSRQRPSDKDSYKFNHNLVADDDTLQLNRRAELQSKTHVITWSYLDKAGLNSLEEDILHTTGRGKNTANGEFVRNLEVGDCITVWCKSRFGGWSNHIDSITMEVYWAV